MSENQFQLANNGQSVIVSDFNQLGSYALMDDRVFAEFLRMLPYNGSAVTKAIFPYQVTGEASPRTVAPNGASGSVLVHPFRAFVGSRTAEATDALKNWRDIRSGIWVGSTSSLTAAVTIAANSSGNPRWDLIYATVTPDASSPTVSRKVKNPSTKVISTQSVVTTLTTTVSVAAVTGTPAASPTFPALPADSAGSYHIALAYVRVPNGFNGTSTVATTDVAAAMPIGQVVSTGALSPASSCDTGKISTALQQSWGSSGTRPVHVLQPDLSRGPTRIVAIDLLDNVSANWSHQSGGVLDDTIDWRDRLFKVTVSVGLNSILSEPPFPWNPATSSYIPNQGIRGGQSYYQSGLADGATLGQFGGGVGSAVLTHLSESFFSVTSGTPAFTGRVIWSLAHNSAGGVFNLPSGASIWVVAESSTGNLKLYVQGVPNAAVFLWIESTTQLSNR